MSKNGRGLQQKRRVINVRTGLAWPGLLPWLAWLVDMLAAASRCRMSVLKTWINQKCFLLGGLLGEGK